MNLQDLTDIKELKALAYDQIMQLESAQNNLRLINQRITELVSPPESTPDVDNKSKL